MQFDAVIILFQNVINLRKDICYTIGIYFNVFVRNLGYDD